MASKRYLVVEHDRSLIPGLPEDVARNCLAMVPRIYHRSMQSVSKSWKKALESWDFFAIRRKNGIADAWLVLILMDLVRSDKSFYCIYDLASKSMLIRAPIPDLSPSNLLPSQHPDQSSGRFVTFKTAAVGSLLVAIESTSSVHQSTVENHTRIFDTVTNKWRRGSTPALPRSSQFVVVAVAGTVYVTGGCDGDGDSITATEAYDIATDTWTPRAAMPYALDRIDGELVFSGKIYVRGFAKSQCRVLVYDPVKDSWHEDRSGIRGMDHGELLATSNAIYNLTATDCLYKFVDGEWNLVGRIDRRSPTTSSFNVHSQRGFVFQDEIFVLGGELGRSFCAIGDGGVEVVCHGLFVGSSWFRVGSIVTG